MLPNDSLLEPRRRYWPIATEYPRGPDDPFQPRALLWSSLPGYVSLGVREILEKWCHPRSGSRGSLDARIPFGGPALPVTVGPRIISSLYFFWLRCRGMLCAKTLSHPPASHSERLSIRLEMACRWRTALATGPHFSPASSGRVAKKSHVPYRLGVVLGPVCTSQKLVRPPAQREVALLDRILCYKSKCYEEIEISMSSFFFGRK